METERIVREQIFQKGELKTLLLSFSPIFEKSNITHTRAVNNITISFCFAPGLDHSEIDI